MEVGVAAATSILGWIQDQGTVLVGLTGGLQERLSTLSERPPPVTAPAVPIISSAQVAGRRVRVEARVGSAYWLVDCWLNGFAVEDFSVTGPIDSPLPGVRHCAGIPYRETGSDAAPGVLLVHGLGYDSAVWWPVLAALTGEARCIAVDLPGHGHSQSQAPGDLTTVSAQLQELLDQLSAPNQDWIIVGHSLGGHIALGIAADRSAQWIGIEGPIWLHSPSRTELGDFLFELTAGQDIPSLLRRVGQPSTLLLAANRESGEDPTLALAVREDLERFIRSELRARVEVRWVDAGHHIPRERPDAVAGVVRSALIRKGQSRNSSGGPDSALTEARLEL